MENLSFKILPSDETSLWRYMSLAKFLSLLQTQSLFFSRADNFGDLFEGSFTMGSINNYLTESGFELGQDVLKLARWIPTRSFISCWHASEYESIALWNTYGTKEGAVAIKSTIGRIKEQFPDIDEASKDELTSQLIAKVQYIDYKTEHPQLGNLISPLCYKRKAFSYENEVRIIRTLLPTKISIRDDGSTGRAINMSESSAEQLLDGINIPVNINELVEAIYIAPSSPGFVKEAVEGIISKFSISANCVQSSLDDIPEYSSYNT